MKKVVRLTESDLTRIVRRVIEERSSKDYVIDIIKTQGIKTAKEMFGSTENIQNILGKEYLEKNLFNILKSQGVDFAVSLVPDAEEFKRILGVQTPMEFLHLFDDFLQFALITKLSDYLLNHHSKFKENLQQLNKFKTNFK